MVGLDKAGARMVVVRIDVLAPINARLFDDYTTEEWCREIARVLGYCIERAQDAVNELLGLGGGVILFVAPNVIGDAAWRTAVAALHGLTRSIAKEYGRANIRCNLLIGSQVELEKLLTENTGITAEIIIEGGGIWGASGLD